MSTHKSDMTVQVKALQTFHTHYETRLLIRVIDLDKGAPNVPFASSEVIHITKATQALHNISKRIHRYIKKASVISVHEIIIII